MEITEHGFREDIVDYSFNDIDKTQLPCEDKCKTAISTGQKAIRIKDH